MLFKILSDFSVWVWLTLLLYRYAWLALYVYIYIYIYIEREMYIDRKLCARSIINTRSSAPGGQGRAERKITHNVKSKISPEGPAKERNRRRVLRTMCKKLFIMRRCAVKHANSFEISLENMVFYEISHFHENLHFFKFYLFGYMHWTLDAHSNVNVGWKFDAWRTWKQNDMLWMPQMIIWNLRNWPENHR